MTTFRCEVLTAHLRAAATVLVVASLSACGQLEESDSNICERKGNLALVGAEVTDPAELHRAARSCVKRFSYIYGSGQDAAEVVANAATLRCDATINAAAIAGSDFVGSPSEEQAISLEDAQRSYFRKFEEQALIWVVEGRAGKCWHMWSE